MGESDPVLLSRRRPLDRCHHARIDDALDRQHRPRAAVCRGTARPDFTPPWLARPHATLLTLGRLGRDECARADRRRRRRARIFGETVAAIVAKTDGVPLFVEELTEERCEVGGRRGAAVPATLKDSLMRAPRPPWRGARGSSDRGGYRPAIYASSAGGGCAEAKGPTRGRARKLVAAGIVFPEGGPGARFSFKHALVRDAAYESLLLARRREWHGRIAQALEEHFPEAAANEPELLAYHFGEAGLTEKACDYRMRAGERALARSAYLEAVANFSAGLKFADTLPESPVTAAAAIRFLTQARAGARMVVAVCKARPPRKSIAAQPR